MAIVRHFLTRANVRSAELTCEELGSSSFGIYAAAGTSRPDLERGPFVTLTDGPAPPATAITACHCESIEVARTLCESSDLLCILPDALVSGVPALQRLGSVNESIALYAVRRTPVTAEEDARLVELVAELRARVGDEPSDQGGNATSREAGSTSTTP
jgi:hypothetical protein